MGPLLRLADAESGGSCVCALAEPFVETDAAEARFGQRHERTLLDDPAAPVSGLGGHARPYAGRLSSPRAAVAHTCQAGCRTAVPRLLSIRYRQRPSSPRRAISLAAPPKCTCLPSGPVPSIDQSTTIWAISPATNTWRALASSGRPRLRSRSSSAAISVRSVTVRPSFAISTASGSYKVIIALTLP